MPTQNAQRDRVRPLEQVREGADREQRHPDPPGRVFALAELVGQQDQQQPDDHRHDVADDRHPQRPDRRPRARRTASARTGSCVSSWSTPQSAVSPAIVLTARWCSSRARGRRDRCAPTGPCRAARRRTRAPPVGDGVGPATLPGAMGVGAASGRGAPPRAAARRRGELGAQRREEDHLADRVDAGQQHHQPVDADARARRCGGMPVLERADVVEVDVARLGVAALPWRAPRPRTRRAARPGRSARCRRCTARSPATISSKRST